MAITPVTFSNDRLINLCSACDISELELAIASNHSTFESQIFSVAELYLRKSIASGMEKKWALSKITYPNLALLLFGNDSNSNTRKAGSILSDIYEKRKKRVTEAESVVYDTLTNISLFRQAIGQKVFGHNFKLNMLVPEKNPFNYLLNSAEQRAGLKIPVYLNERIFFLLGVMRASASRGKDLRISGQNGDADFYCGVLEDIIQENFNILPRTAILPHEYHSAKKGAYVLNDVSMSFNWCSVKKYVNDFFNVFSKDGLEIPKFVPESHVADMSLAYFMGMLAGGSSVSVYQEKAKPHQFRSPKLILEFHDKDGKYLSEILRINKEQGYMLDFKDNVARPSFRYLNKRDVIRLTEWKVPFYISDTQVGMFVNNRQLSKLFSNGLITSTVPGYQT
jgi:hypothetical protein